MGVKINLRIITKNHAADPETRFLTNPISKPYDRVTDIPPAWELSKKKQHKNLRLHYKLSFIIISEKKLASFKLSNPDSVGVKNEIISNLYSFMIPANSTSPSFAKSCS